jgi:glycosyltransferase EpsH
VHTVSRKNLEDRMVAGRQILAEARENGYLEKYKPEIEFMYTVLFYVNTLFSAMPKRMRIEDCYNFTKKMGIEMKEAFPDFQENPYYKERIHAEEKKLIGMQMKSHLLFYVYYRLLWMYRDLRS